MDDEALEKFAAYCRQHQITFVLRRRGQSFSIEFSTEDEDQVKELLEYLKGRENNGNQAPE